MTWNYWVLNIAAEAEPPDEWQHILASLTGLISTDYINKIGVAAFAIRGKRTARWLLPPSDAEFSTLQDALGAAKKLTWLLLKSGNAPPASNNLFGMLRCTKSPQCVLLEGHEGECTEVHPVGEVTKCPVCRETIEFDAFKRPGRTDPLSIQMGHLTPLSRATAGHNAGNVVWVHRRCNYIQDEQTIKETIVNLCEIVKKHGYLVSIQDEASGKL